MDPSRPRRRPGPCRHDAANRRISRRINAQAVGLSRLGRIQLSAPNGKDNKLSLIGIHDENRSASERTRFLTVIHRHKTLCLEKPSALFPFASRVTNWSTASVCLGCNRQSESRPVPSRKAHNGFNGIELLCFALNLCFAVPWSGQGLDLVDRVLSAGRIVQSGRTAYLPSPCPCPAFTVPAKGTVSFLPLWTWTPEGQQQLEMPLHLPWVQVTSIPDNSILFQKKWICSSESHF